MWNDWLKAPTYLWVESLVSSMSETTWKNEVTVEVKDEPISGSWAEKAQFCKAARCYAVEKGLYAKDVAREMIAATALDIRGYAELYASTPAAFPQPGGDGSASKNSGPKPPGAAPAPAPTAKGKAGKRKEQVTSPDLEAAAKPRLLRRMMQTLSRSRRSQRRVVLVAMSPARKSGNSKSSWPWKLTVTIA